MRNRIVLPLVGLASLLAIAAVFVFRPLPTTITRENAARLKPGMTMAEVVDILGEPRSEVSLPSSTPGPSTHPMWTGIYARGLGSWPLPPPRDRRRWVGESIIITVVGDAAEAKVLEIEVTNREFSSWEYAWWRVRRVLGLAPDVPTPVEWTEDPAQLTVW